MISIFSFLAVAKSQGVNVGIETSDSFYVGTVASLDGASVTLDHGEGDMRLITMDSITNIATGPSVEAHRRVRDHNRRAMIRDLNAMLAEQSEPVADNVVNISSRTLN